MNKATVTKLLRGGWLKPTTRKGTINQPQADTVVRQYAASRPKPSPPGRYA